MQHTMTIILTIALFFTFSCKKEKSEPANQSKSENITEKTPEEPMEEETSNLDQCIGSWLVGDDNIRQFIDIPKDVADALISYCLVIHADMTANIIIPSKERKYTFNGKVTKDGNNYILEIDGKTRYFGITDKNSYSKNNYLYIKYINSINDNFKDGAIDGFDGKKWDLLCKKYGDDCSMEGCIKEATGYLDIYYPHDPPPADVQ